MELDSNELIEKYTQLLHKRDALKEKLVQLQTTQNHYKSEMDKYASCLKNEFNVSTLSEAIKLENKMKTEISQKLEELEKAINDCQETEKETI